MMDERNYIAPGVSGWSKRQAAAEKRTALSRQRSENDEARRRQREFEDRLAEYVNQAKAEGRDKDEAYREFVEGRSAESAPEPTEPEPPAQEPDVSDDATAEDEPEAGEAPDPADMGRDALISELQDAGQRVHPSSKDATLRAKVEALRE